MHLPLMPAFLVAMPLVAYAAEPEAPATGAPAAAAAHASNELCFRLYGELKDSPDNFAVSPYSLHRLLRMLQDGAERETAAEFLKLLAQGDNAAERAVANAALSTSLAESARDGGLVVQATQHLWHASSCPLRHSYEDLVHTQYGVTPDLQDFSKPEAARARLNGLVAQATQWRIHELFPPGSIESNTRLVVANCLYLRGQWSAPFKTKDTKMLPFWITPEQSRPTPLMQQQSRFAMSKGDGFRMLRLPFGQAKQDFAMYVILPNEKGGLASAEKALTLDALEKTIAAQKQDAFRVALPRFSFAFGGDFTAYFAALGLVRAFDPAHAQFGPMTAEKPVFIKAIFHQTALEVDERGAVVASSSGAIAAFGSDDKPPPTEPFVADHPFLFLIRHDPTGLIVTLGRVVKP